MPGQEIKKDKKITPQQKSILDSNADLKRVIACAGSGKTFVLTQNIIEILNKGKCRPEEILAITFTRNAADNMRGRIKESLTKKINFSDINIYTFNSFGNLIISENSFLMGLGKDYRLINISKSWQIIYEIIKMSGFEIIRIGKDTGKFTQDVLQYIHELKSNLITPSDLKKYYSEKEEVFSTFSSSALLAEELEILKYQPDLCNIYENYENKKHENNLVDYFDHVFLPYALLKENAEIREKYRKKYRYIFIDEFQDTDLAQGYFISMLYEHGHNSIMIVGDDDQGIYSFRGACIENILDFHNWNAFSGHAVKDFFLTTNFRSGQNIIETINDLISFNEYRFEKDLKPEYENKKSEVIFSVFDTFADEADQIAAQITELNLSGIKLKDIAILARKKRFRHIAEALEKHGLKYEIISSKGFYYEPEILFIISWLMVIANTHDDVHLLYLLQSLKYKISDRDIYFMKNFDPGSINGQGRNVNFSISLFDGIMGSSNNPYLKKETKMRLKDFLEEMNHYISQSFSLKLNELISIIYEYSGLACELKSGFNKNGKRKIKNIELLIKISADFDSGSMENNLGGFIVYLKDVAKSQEEDPESVEFRQSDSIKIMSIHASKGLEFEAVFLPMLWKNDYSQRTSSGKFKIPALLRKDRKIYRLKKDFKSKQKFESEIKKLNTEEERRIFYVACSRAKKLLFLSYSEQDADLPVIENDKKPKLALPFLTEILIKSGTSGKIRLINEKACEVIEKIVPESEKAKDSVTCPEDFLQVLSDYLSADSALKDARTVLKGKKISQNIFDECGSENIERILARQVKSLDLSAYGAAEKIMHYKKIVGALKNPVEELSRKKIVSPKKHFSMTELLRYLECPAKYKWKYIYNIPEPSGEQVIIGDKVHKLIELLTMQSYGDIVDTNFLPVTDNVKIINTLDTQVDDCLNNYVKSSFYSDPGVKRIILEQLFYYNLKGFIISCKLDRLDFMADGSLRIIDYKTSSLKGLKLSASYLNQVKSYTCGVSSLYSVPLKYIKTFLFYLKDAGIYAQSFGDEDIAVFEKSLSEACDNINRRVFPKKTKDSCSQKCFYFTLCRKHRYN